MTQQPLHDFDSFIKAEYIPKKMLTKLEEILNEESVNQEGKLMNALRYLVSNGYYCLFDSDLNPHSFQKLTFNMKQFLRMINEDFELIFLQKGDKFETFSTHALTAAKHLAIETKKNGSIDTVLIDLNQLNQLKEVFGENKIKTILFIEEIKEGQIISNLDELPPRIKDEIKSYGKWHTLYAPFMLNQELIALGYYINFYMREEFLQAKKLTAYEREYFDFVADQGGQVFTAQQIDDHYIVYENHADRVVYDLGLDESRIDRTGPFGFVKLTHAEYEYHVSGLEAQGKKHHLIEGTRVNYTAIDDLPQEVVSLLESYDIENLSEKEELQFRNELISLGYYVPQQFSRELDKIQQLPPNAFMYFQLKKKYPNQIILFKVGQQYEAFDTSAWFVDQYLQIVKFDAGFLEKVVISMQEYQKLLGIAKKNEKRIRIFEAA